MPLIQYERLLSVRNREAFVVLRSPVWESAPETLTKNDPILWAQSRGFCCGGSRNFMT